MGFFTHALKSIKSKVKQAGNWHDISNKAARVWNQGTQILGKSRSFIGKAKRVAEVAMLVPGLGEISAPIAAGLETADFALGEIDKHRKTAERYGKKAKKTVNQVSRKVDTYAARADDVYANRDFKGAVKLGRDIYKDSRKTYKQGRQAYRQGRDMYSQARQPRRNQRAIANRPYYEPVW